MDLQVSGERSRGGVTGALIEMGIPKLEAKRYANRLKKGILLSVHSDSSAGF
jgi:hypothetical protein